MDEWQRSNKGIKFEDPMLYANSSLANAITYIYRNLPTSQSIFIEMNPLFKDNDNLRYVRVRRSSFITMHDYYDWSYRESHPAKGMVVTIAGLDYDDRDDDLDYLLRNAMSDARLMNDENSRYLVAEIDSSDSFRRNLFERNNFNLAFEMNDTRYYVFDSRL